MKPFDPTKPVQTRDGRKARIIATDKRCERYSIVALVDYGNHESTECFTTDGRYRYEGGQHQLDLQNILEKRTLHGWMNLYPCGDGFFCPTKEEADKNANRERIACIEINQEYEIP